MANKIQIKDKGRWILIIDPTDPHNKYGKGIEKGNLSARIEKLGENPQAPAFREYLIIEKGLGSSKQVVGNFPVDQLDFPGRGAMAALFHVMDAITLNFYLHAS